MIAGMIVGAPAGERLADHAGYLMPVALAGGTTDTSTTQAGSPSSA